MRNVIFILVFMFVGGVYAQETDNKKVETETKTVKVKTNKGTAEQKTELTTKEEENIELANDESHFENMNVVERNSKTSQSMTISYDFDPFYNTDTKEMYQYQNEGKSYNFKPNDSGFMMTQHDSVDNAYNARLSSIDRFYLIDMGDHNGVGYFKENGKFVVEYYDKNSQTMVVKEFVEINQ
ncbi:hypothetical protein SAMN03097699_1027 [Flavobacteriaceae bacterium MAR_2010_188]|nr:hypothetical protein SAMN03097699_1027 [Flavobacteriaceae bacterium MAR_2010_188]